jgi:phosphoesterase RecJ-like protein
MDSINLVLPLLQSSKKIFITTHYKPDADAIGSSLGLYHYLVQKGHDVTVVAPSDLPSFLLWMPGVDQVLNFEAEPNKSIKALSEAELIFCLDFNHLGRVKQLEPHLRNSDKPFVLIDHHLEPELQVFSYGVSNPAKSSTSEMIYDFIMMNRDDRLINNEIMECIYAGVMTDTGSFRFAGTTASVHEMIACFKHKGFEHAKVHNLIYDTWSIDRMRFLGYILYQKMEIYLEYGLGIIPITNEDMHLFNISSGDTEGLVNYPLSIEGVNLSILVSERKKEVKLSFRSQGNIDVSTFARRFFNGGGHFNAAGGTSHDKLDETIQKVKTLIINPENFIKQ